MLLKFELSSNCSLIYQKKEDTSFPKEFQKFVSNLSFDSLSLLSLMWKSDWKKQDRQKSIYDFASNLIVIPTEKSFSLFKKFQKTYQTHWDELASDLVLTNPIETRFQRELNVKKYDQAKDFLIKCYHILTKLSVRGLEKFQVGSNFKELKFGPWKRVIILDPQCNELYLLNFDRSVYEFSDEPRSVEKLYYSNNKFQSETLEIKFESSLDKSLEALLNYIPDSNNQICLLEFQRDIDIDKLKSDVLINNYILQQFKSQGWEGASNILVHSLEIDGNSIIIPSAPEIDVFVFKNNEAIIIETKRRKWITVEEKKVITKFFGFFSILRNWLTDVKLTGIFLSTGNIKKFYNSPLYGSSFYIVSPYKFVEIIFKFTRGTENTI